MKTTELLGLEFAFHHADLVEMVDGIVVIHESGVTIRLDSQVAAKVAREVVAAGLRNVA